MVVLCITMTAITSQIEGVRWIKTPRALFRLYLRSGWFVVDARHWGVHSSAQRGRHADDGRTVQHSLSPPPAPRPCAAAAHTPQVVTLISSLVDVVTLFVSRGAQHMRRLKILRVLRALKLVKLAKILRASRLMQHCGWLIVCPLLEDSAPPSASLDS